MQPDTIILMTFMTLLTGGLGTMFWSRLGRIEDELKELRQQVGILGSDLTHVALTVGTKPRSVKGE